MMLIFKNLKKDYIQFFWYNEKKYLFEKVRSYTMHLEFSDYESLLVKICEDYYLEDINISEISKNMGSPDIKL